MSYYQNVSFNHTTQADSRFDSWIKVREFFTVLLQVECKILGGERTAWNMALLLLTAPHNAK